MFKFKCVGPLVGWLLTVVTPAWAQTPADAIDFAAMPPPAKLQVDFARDVAPILRERCLSCHGSVQQQSGLRLDNPTDGLKGGYSGPAIRPGSSRDSRLIQIVVGLTSGLTAANLSGKNAR